MTIEVRKNGTIETLAVIVTNDGGLVEIETFPNTEEGEMKAKEHFKGQVKNINPNVTDGQIDLHLKDGFYSYGLTTVFIAHS